jgi:hypothetical protein
MSVLLDGVSMSLSEKTDNVAGLINEYREQAHDVSPEYTNVQSLNFSNRPILPTEDNRAVSLAIKPNLGFNQNRIDYSTYPTNPIPSHPWLKRQIY